MARTLPDRGRPNSTKYESYRARIRAEALEAYGGRCEHCGLDNPVVLQFAHRDRDGAARRLAAQGPLRSGKSRGGGHHYLRHLRDAGWPDHILLLCANCHLIYDHKEEV